MKIKVILAAYFGVIWGMLAAQEMVLFQSDFNQPQPLNGWTDVFQKSPPQDTEIYRVTEENGKKVLQTGKSCFGLSAKFTHPLVIDETVKKVKLEVTFRQLTEFFDYQIEMALSSRPTVSANDGRAFWPMRDSGFIVSGYIHEIQRSNALGYQINGKQVKAYRNRAPFHFLTENDRPVTWSLVYDNQQKTLSFFNQANASEPFVTIYQVDLNQVELNSVWITAWYVVYENIRVSYEK